MNSENEIVFAFLTYTKVRHLAQYYEIYIDALWSVLDDVIVTSHSAYKSHSRVVSAPDPHVTPARKRVWYLTSAFLVVLSQHVNVNCVIRPDNHVIE